MSLACDDIFIGLIDHYCEGEVFAPICDENKVILMKEARYGRMKLGRCVQTDYGHIGCASNVLRIMDSLCSGR